jgi:hypothetical protein
MYPPSWNSNCTQQVGMETVPSSMVQYTLRVGAECVPCVSFSRALFFFIYNYSFLHKTVRTSLYGIKRTDFSEQWSKKMGQETAEANFVLAPRHSPGRTEKNHEKNSFRNIRTDHLVNTNHQWYLLSQPTRWNTGKALIPTVPDARPKSM